MKLVARLATALALLAFATPALPCGAEKKTTTASETKKEQPVAKAEKKATKSEKKVEKKQSSVKVKAPAETRSATAQ